MEPGTALAVLAMIKPTIKTIIELWQDTSHFGADIRGLSVRFNASKAFLNHYESILFTKNKFPGVSGMLYETLPDSERLTIFDMLGEPRLVLDTYVEASKRDALNADRTRGRKELDALVLATARAKDEEQAKAVGWMKKTWWAVWEKKIVEKLVRDFEKWIKKLRQLIKLVWGPLPFLTSLSQLQKVERDHVAEEVGLLEDVPLRKLIVAPPNTQTLNHKPTNATLSILTDHIRQQLRIGVILELPPGLDGPPTTLLSALSSQASFSSFRPSLDARMRLARALAETVLLLHSINWLHKSIRSETVLLLSEATTTSPPPRGPPNLEHSRLSEFEYSRLDNDFTSANPDFDLQRNIYRHPERWDYPKESFPKIHDIYSLGVVLLEIGLWEPIINFDGKKGGESLNEHYPNAHATKDRLVRHATKRLGFCAGEKYQELVLKCLKGDFGDLSGDDKIGTGLQRQLRKEVDRALKATEHTDEG
ncbi:MAG: hypothetical protein Q9192_005125 [Flavoplaca navasiana]